MHAPPAWVQAPTSASSSIWPAARAGARRFAPWRHSSGRPPGPALVAERLLDRRGLAEAQCPAGRYGDLGPGLGVATHPGGALGHREGAEPGPGHLVAGFDAVHDRPKCR